jgi:hypothetical protein
MMHLNNTIASRETHSKQIHVIGEEKRQVVSACRNNKIAQQYNKKGRDPGIQNKTKDI